MVLCADPAEILLQHHGGEPAFACQLSALPLGYLYKFSGGQPAFTTLMKKLVRVGQAGHSFQR